ncbi:MAG: hypothetical protein PHW27_11755 [Melioribacteraceae bacterium]|nr:hypothetical protein [Melioribacteraceae bacterium]MDD3559232.1 hypothetical protein [Melioribacteraceae bacterium]
MRDHLFFYLIVPVIVSFIAVSCSSSEESTDKSQIDEEYRVYYEPSINLQVEKIYAWVDYMPGGKPKFHITGDLAIPSTDDYSSSDVELVLIRIHQQQKIVYQILPTVQEIDMTSDGVRKIMFSTLSGLFLEPWFNPDDVIDVELRFSGESGNYEYIAFNVEVDKAY